MGFSARLRAASSAWRSCLLLTCPARHCATSRFQSFSKRAPTSTVGAVPALLIFVPSMTNLLNRKGNTIMSGLANILRAIADKLDPRETPLQRHYRLLKQNRAAPATKDFARNHAAQKGGVA